MREAALDQGLCQAQLAPEDSIHRLVRHAGFPRDVLHRDAAVCPADQEATSCIEDAAPSHLRLLFAQRTVVCAAGLDILDHCE